MTAGSFPDRHDQEPGRILKKAKGYALRLFQSRPRTESELKDRLLEKGYPVEASLTVIGEFKTLGLVDDQAFAKLWFQSRLRKYGYRRVARELADKGVLNEIIGSEWEKLRGDYDEKAAVRGIAERRLKQYKGIPPLKRRKRLMDYLARRGFSVAVINEYIGKVNI